MVVLVNGKTAAASEVIAAALRHHRRAVMPGSRTFGGGTVQTILPIDERSALKLTTHRLLTPAGAPIDGSGIIPDVVLDAGVPAKAPDAAVTKALRVLKEQPARTP